MVKKGTKRKTRWRTLSIGDGGTDITDTGKTELKQDSNECLTTTSNTNLSTYSRKASSFTAPFHQRNGDRNHYYRNSDKYPSHPPTRSQSQEDNFHQQSTYSYKRRPFYQTSSSRYYGNTNKLNNSNNNRPYLGSYRSADTIDNKENNTTKPLFNEDEYTRITTPRQDVLFKKGYLSRPKKTITPIDSTVSSSTTVSVVSTEESISSSNQSISPEHFSSTPEIFDPEHPLMYQGFYDQNGVFFVNPFITNGFDPYGGQMIMMPYGGSPFSINPSEYSSSTPPYPENHYQKRNSIDSENSPESPSSQNESVSASSTPATDESSNEPSHNGDIPMESQSESDGIKPDEETTPNECNHNMAMQFYYPFMYGPPPFLPINEDYNEHIAQYINGFGVKYNRLRKRKRRQFKCGNSTGVSATTTDYSEDEDSIEGNNAPLNETPQHNDIDSMTGKTMAECDDVISRTTLNTNVSEFVPKHLQSTPSRTTTLNVEVEEFHPRNYPSSVQSQASDNADIINSAPIQKPVTPETKVTILHRTSNEKKCQINAINTSKGKPEQNNLQTSSAIYKSSTLISSISTRDKNDDNVNGVDNNKKTEKLIDPVNFKADLDDKIVTHPKQNENILENVRKTKLKKIIKSSPRKTNNSTKKDIKAVKGKITDGANVQLNTKDKVEENKLKNENISGVVEGMTKPNQPTYAQMLGPVTKIKDAKPAIPDHTTDIVKELTPDELKMFEVLDDVKPEVKIVAKWQTVRPKGKKKLASVIFDDVNDEWDEFAENKSDKMNEIAEEKKEEINIEQEISTSVLDKIDESAISTISKPKPPKTEKAKLKIKAKRSQKKIRDKNSKTNGIANVEDNNPIETSTPKKPDEIISKSMTPIIDNLFDDEGQEFLNDIDISNFNFETSPSLFVNAITNSGIYTDNSVTGKSNAGFALNNSLKLLNFCKTKENILLKEEEEMVIRVLKSLNQTENQIVNITNEQLDAPHCNKIIDEVEIDVKIEKNIVEDVNGDESHEDAKNAINGAEIIVKCEMNDEMDGMDRERTNGHQIEYGDNCCVNDFKEDHNVEPEIIQKLKNQIFEDIKMSNGNHEDITNLSSLAENEKQNGFDICTQQKVYDSQKCNLIFEKNDLDNITLANKVETENNGEISDEITDEEQITNKDCMSYFKQDDETQSDLSELSDENEETIVSQTNDYLEFDDLDTIKDVDVTETIDDLQFDDDVDDFVILRNDEYGNANEIDQNELNAQSTIREISLENVDLPQSPMNNIFIESEADILKTEITLNDIKESKENDRIQSPRNSEDSGILEYQDDGRYFSESDNDKPEQIILQKFPLTEAVSRWLEEKQKEKSPEPIFRLPVDSVLSERIEKSIRDGLHISEFDDDYDDDDTSDDSETEFETTNPSKNLFGNPLRVLFRKNSGQSTNNVQSNDVKHNANTNDNGTRTRVAKYESDKSSVTIDEPDILEFWENDPMLQNSNVLKHDQNASIESDLEAYESVYGKTIDYAKLTTDIHNDNVFLSNNILNNDNLSKLPITSNNNNNDSSLLHHASSINRKDNTNLNCFKPPEICCMLM